MTRLQVELVLATIHGTAHLGRRRRFSNRLGVVVVTASHRSPE